MENWQIRPCRDETDRASLKALHERLLVLEPGSRPILDEDAATDTFILLASLGETPLGALRLVRDGHRGQLESIAVLPDFRRQGLGRDLVRELEKWAISKEIQELTLDTDPAARAFFLALGFTEAGPPRLEVGVMRQAMRRELL